MAESHRYRVGLYRCSCRFLAAAKTEALEADAAACGAMGELLGFAMVSPEPSRTGSAERLRPIIAVTEVSEQRAV
jgi:hypothetical protein